jgi:hypothetical protein
MATEKVTFPLTVLANHFRPWTSKAARVFFFPMRREAVGGKLTIDRDELTFRPHELNLQTQVTKWPCASIEGFEPTNTMGLIPNGVTIHFLNGDSEQFVVGKRAQVLDALGRITAERVQAPPEQRALELAAHHETDLIGSWTTDYGGWSPASEDLRICEDGTGQVSGLSNATFRWAPHGRFAMKVWDMCSQGEDAQQVDPKEHIVTWKFEVQTMHDGEKVVALKLSPASLLVVHSLIC